MSAGRRWAYGGAILGAAVSIAANVAHSYVPPASARTDWTPQPGAVALAIFWPVALLVGIEILARVQWPAGWKWWLARWLGLVPVAAVAAVVSYRHLSGLLAFYGEDALTVAIGPLAVDGLMVMATGALLAPAREVQQRAPGPVHLAEVVQLVDDAHRAAAAVERQPAVTLPVPEVIEAPAAPAKTGSNPERAREMRGQGVRNAEIARRLGVTPQTVSGYFKQSQSTPQPS